MPEHLDYMDLSALAWKRPSGTPLKVWRVVEGRKKTEDGKTLKFSIQDIPEDRYEDVVDFMCDNFLAEEPVSVSLKFKDDPLVVQEIGSMWRSMVRQGISVAALTDNPNGGKPLIAGVNVVGVITPQDEAFLNSLKIKSDVFKKTMGIIFSMSHEVNLFSKYGVDCYMTALGLSVLPSMRGQGIGFHLLKAREDIGREFHIPATKNTFTARASQILSERAGYEVYLEKNYSDLIDEEGKPHFPGVTVKSITLAGKRLY